MPYIFLWAWGFFPNFSAEFGGFSLEKAGEFRVNPGY